MHFDTFEAFARAVYRRAGFLPVSVHDEFEHISLRALRANNRELLNDLSAAKREVTGMFVRLVQACYDVHEISTSHAAPGDDLLGYRIEQARKQLIPGWQLVIQVSNGNAVVMLIDDQDRLQNFPSSRDSLSGQVTDAVLFAERTPEKRRTAVQYTEDPDHGEHLT